MTDSKEELNCGEHPEMTCKQAHKYHVEGLIRRDHTIDQYEKLLDESREREKKLKEAVMRGIAGLCRQLKEDSMTTVNAMEEALKDAEVK